MKTIALGECCRFVSGGTPSKARPEFWRGAIPWFSPKDMKSFDLVDSRDHISSEAVSSSATQAVEAGTILVVARSGVLAHTLPVGIIRRAAAFNQDIRAMLPEQGLDADFVALFLRAQQPYVLAQGVKIGATVHSLRSGFLEALRIPVVAEESQRHIATRLKAQLATVEQARQAALAQLAESDALRLAIYREAFVDANRFHEVRISEVAPVQSGYAFKSEDFKRTGVRLLRNANIQPGRVYWDDVVFLAEKEATTFDKFALSEGDVLLSLDRPLVADGLKVARVSLGDLPALLVQRVGRFQIDHERLVPDYLFAFLNSAKFIDAITGHEQSLGVPHISPEQVGAVFMPLPTSNQQLRIMRALKVRLAAAHKLRAAAQTQLADIEALPARLLAQAFDPDHFAGTSKMVDERHRDHFEDVLDMVNARTR